MFLDLNNRLELNSNTPAIIKTKKLLELLCLKIFNCGEHLKVARTNINQAMNSIVVSGIYYEIEILASLPNSFLSGRYFLVVWIAVDS
jgi:hypothetical protein